MEQGKLSDPLKALIEDFKSYLENLITYNKLIFVKGASELSSYLMLLIVLFGISGFVLLFFSFAFAGWFAQITGWGLGAGYLVVALIYIILGILVFYYRKPLVFNPARRVFGEIFFTQFDNKDIELSFDTEESHQENIQTVHKKLRKQKEDLNNKINEFEKNLTISNIINQLFGKAYSTIMTSSNVAKFLFTVIKLFKRSKKKKPRKSSGKKLNENNREHDDD